MDFLRAGQVVVSEFESATTGMGYGKTTGGTYDCELGECEYNRTSIYWEDGTIKYTCTYEMVYDQVSDSWKMKDGGIYCKHGFDKDGYNVA